MLKNFCDLCNSQILPGDTNVSLYQFIEWKLDKQGRTPIGKKEDYCGQCTLNVRNAIKGLKTEEK